MVHTVIWYIVGVQQPQTKISRLRLRQFADTFATHAACSENKSKHDCRRATA